MSTIVLTGAKGGLASLFVSFYTQSHPDDHLACLIRDADHYSPLPSPSEANIEHITSDLTDLNLVRAAAKHLRERVKSGQIPHISALICSASAQRVGGLTRVGKDQWEETVTVNHLAHLVLILELLPALEENGRVIIFGAEAHRPDYKFFRRTARYQPLGTLLDGELDGEGDERDKGLERYSTSKLLQLMTGYELARRLARSSYPNIRVIMFNPGVMAGTGLFREHGPVQWAVMQGSIAVPSIANTIIPELGAARKHDSAELLQRIVEGKVNEPKEGEAPYYDHDGTIIPTHPDARDEVKGKELWEDSVRVLGYEGVLA